MNRVGEGGRYDGSRGSLGFRFGALEGFRDGTIVTRRKWYGQGEELIFKKVSKKQIEEALV